MFVAKLVNSLPHAEETERQFDVTKNFKIKKEGKITPGGRLNKKNGLTRYGDSHVKDKTS